MKIYLAHLKDFSIHDLEESPYLSKDRLDKANRYYHLSDKKRSLLGGYLIARFTKPGEITFNEHNKPLKDNDHFNLSHDNDYVVLIEDEHLEVGIDIQHIEKFIKDDLDKFVFAKKLSPKEFYSKWTRMEALSKCLGSGLAENFKHLPHEEGLNHYMNKDIYVETLYLKGKYVLSYAYESNLRLEVEIIKVLPED